jgi:hypothetical protein
MIWICVSALLMFAAVKHEWYDTTLSPMPDTASGRVYALGFNPHHHVVYCTLFEILQVYGVIALAVLIAVVDGFWIYWRLQRRNAGQP